MQGLQYVALKHKWIPIILTLSSFLWCSKSHEPVKGEPNQPMHLPSSSEFDRKKKSKSEL